jgi:hypothetical protein
VKTKVAFAVLTVLCSMAFVGPVSAVTLTTSSSSFMGTIVPNVPSSPTDEATYINALNSLAPGGGGVVSGQTLTRSANTLCFPTCPDVTTAGSVTNESGSSTNIDVTGFTYLLAKYDAAQGGGLVWFVGGLSGLFDVQATFGTCGAQGCGLSHWALFGPTTTVPEPSTLLLLGSALVGLGVYARKR